MTRFDLLRTSCILLSQPLIPPFLSLQFLLWNWLNSSKLPFQGHPSLRHLTFMSRSRLAAIRSGCLSTIATVQTEQRLTLSASTQEKQNVCPHGWIRVGLVNMCMHLGQVRCFDILLSRYSKFMGSEPYILL